jgi:DNA primase
LAGQIPRDFIDSLLSRVDIVELINSYTPLTKKGTNYTACCPFHGEKTPSFSVSATKQFYHCFGCGVSGNAITFLREYEHLEFLDAIDELADRLGVDVPKISYKGNSQAYKNKKSLFDLLDIASNYYSQHLQSQLNNSSNTEIANYIKQRDLSPEVIKSYAIGFSPSQQWDLMLRNLQQHEKNMDTLVETGLVIHNEDKNKYYDRFRNRLMFPIRDKRGRTIGFGGRIIEKDDKQAKYINSPETPLFHKGSELYGLYELTQALRKIEHIIVVEGYMDVVSLAQHGIAYAVATLGTATTTTHLEKLFRTCSDIIFCFDGDKAGKEAASKAMFNLLPLIKPGYQARFMFVDEGEDPDSLVRKLGKIKFEEQLKKSSLLSDFFFDFLLQKVDISLSEGRSQLIDLARPYIQTIPSDSAFYLLMKDRLAKVSGVNTIDLETLFLKNKKNDRQYSFLNSNESNKLQNNQTLAQPLLATIDSLVWKAITYLLQYPEFANLSGNPDNYQDFSINGIKIFIRLLDLIQYNPHISSARIISLWDNSQEEALLEKAIFTPLLIEDKDAISDEYMGILKLFSQHKIQSRIEQLQFIHTSNGLTEKEIKEYVQLLALQHK